MHLHGARLAGALLVTTITACGARPRDAAAPAPMRTLAAAIGDTVESVLRQALTDSAFPGAVAVVGRADTVLATVATGVLDAADDRTPHEHTLWDIASLTKVVGLTSAVMQLNAAGRLPLDTPVERLLDDWRVPGGDRITIRHLLSHTAGLPPFRRLWLETNDADSARLLLLATAPTSLPGEQAVYSDIGAWLLGEIVQHVRGEPLDRYLARELFEPLAMYRTMYRPPPELVAATAPTEVDPWRGRHVRGEVHDENAFLLGGVAGHAGLFSTAHDLARFARMLLRGGELDGTRVLDARTIAAFTAPHDPSVSSRALGWDTADGSNSGGRCLSAAAFGHTGFTGTSLWMDPRRDLFVILLSNRVNPSRSNTRIAAVRVALVHAVCDVLDRYSVSAHRPTTEHGSPP